MKKPLHSLLSLSIFTAMLLTGCGDYNTNASTTPAETPIDTPASQPSVPPTTITANDKQQVLAGMQQFNTAFYQQVKEPTQANAFYSPFSLYTAMGMVYQGANGQTANEMAKVLNAPDQMTLAEVSRQMMNEINQPNMPYVLKSANALWVQNNYPIHPTYQTTLTNNYLAKITNLDFIGNQSGATKTINDYIASETNNKIQNILSDNVITVDTRAILTNAIYFKSDWLSVFDKASTQPTPFNLINGSKITVPMMFQNNYFKYGENTDLQIVSLPYKGEKLAMTIILPKDNRFTKVENSLFPTTMANWHQLMTETTKVDLYLPKFKMETKYDLADTFKKMGMPTAFSPMADFSGITSKDNLSISDVIHQAFIEVDETGTEAAAATAIAATATAAVVEDPPKQFKTDRPFIFMIEDTTNGNVLFMGKVMNPSK